MEEILLFVRNVFRANCLTNLRKGSCLAIALYSGIDTSFSVLNLSVPILVLYILFLFFCFCFFCLRLNIAIAFYFELSNSHLSACTRICLYSYLLVLVSACTRICLYSYLLVLVSVCLRHLRVVTKLAVDSCQEQTKFKGKDKGNF